MSDEEQMGESAPLSERSIEQTGAALRRAMPAVMFGAGFTDRAMARLVAERITVSPDVLRFTAMQRSFHRLAAAAAIVIIALGAHNTMLVRAEHTSLVEAALGLEPVSAESAFASTADTYQ